MMEKIAMWGGIAAIFVAIFAVIILYLTRNNIIELLDRDVVMYDKNYEAKKDALEQAFKCLDVVASNGVEVKSNPQFILQAKGAYNGLLCTVNSAKLYQEFYRITIDPAESGYTVEEIERFKITCRSELLYKRKNKHEGFKGSALGGMNSMTGFGLSSMASQQRPAPRPRPQPRQPQDNE